jgi:hypothetical protein
VISARDTGISTPSVPPSSSRGRARRLRWLQALALFLIVIGANWAFVDHYGSDVPNWDQWDAEGLHLIAPWYEHDHFLSHLLEPQNEHRSIITKVQNLGLVLATGQWDERVQLFFNAMLHAAIALGLWRLARKVGAAEPGEDSLLRRAAEVAMFVLTAAVYSLPLACNNLLAGFHSAQYWLIALSAAAILLLPFEPPGSRRWWLGLVAAVLALGSMGSGFLAAGVVLGLLLIDAAFGQPRRRLRAWLPSLLVAAAIVVLGVLTRVERAYHDPLKAKTAHDFFLYSARSLAWPFHGADWAGLVLWAPWVVLFVATARTLFRRGTQATSFADPECRIDVSLVALGGWTFIQILATAYARGAGADYPATRYMDTLMFGGVINGITAGRLLLQHGNRARPSLWSVGATLWLVFMAVGLTLLSHRNFLEELVNFRAHYRGSEQHLRAYLATDDLRELEDPIPYPAADELAKRLQHRALRGTMPVSVRPALAVTTAQGHGFAEDFRTPHNASAKPAPLPGEVEPFWSRRTWSSYAGSGEAGLATWRSQPVSTVLNGYLEFRVAGDLGRPDLTLELRSAADNRLLRSIRPQRKIGHGWASVYVPAPAEPFAIVAADNAPAAWFAFSAPAEMSSGSYFAWRYMHQGWILVAIGVALAVVCFFRTGRRKRP